MRLFVVKGQVQALVLRLHADGTSVIHIKEMIMTNKNIEGNDVLENMSGSATPKNTETPTDQVDSHGRVQNPTTAATDQNSGDATEFSRWWDSLPPLD